MLTVQKEDGAIVTYSPARLYGVNVYRESEREFAVGDRLTLYVSQRFRRQAITPFPAPSIDGPFISLRGRSNRIYRSDHNEDTSKVQAVVHRKLAGGGIAISMTNIQGPDPRIIFAVEQAVEAKRGGRPIGREKLLNYTGPTLSFLAKRAHAHRMANYSEVSAALGLGNAQWANVAFGCVYRILRMVEGEHLLGEGLIPDITAIVTKKGKLSLGKGLLANNPDLAGMQPLEQLSAVEVLRQEVFRWPYWMQLLALLGLEPLADLDSDDGALTKFASQSGPKGKSLEHIQALLGRLSRA